jgi:predicted enzyme related to lactoylglutathione lyase
MLFRDEPWPEGTPSWVDLVVPDQAKAVAFYRGLLGWDVRPGGEETGFYGRAMLRGRPVAGIGRTPPGRQMPAGWTTYLSVSDVDKTAAAIGEAGGQVVVPVTNVPAQGRSAIAVDPGGAAFGLWEPGGHHGTQVMAGPGALAWNECMSPDYPAVEAFYERVFGYGFEDETSGDSTYKALLASGRPVGGIGALPAEATSSWRVYFWVADADASAARAVELGGRLLGEPFDSPEGRHVQLADDQGVPFFVIAPTGQSGKPRGWDD